MSQFGKHGRRCDWCGKFSNARDGEYTRPVKNDRGVNLAGYIRQPSWHFNDDGSLKPHHRDDTELDICEECANGMCPKCGGKEIVRISPVGPGPDGWGSRCKTCGFRWQLNVSLPTPAVGAAMARADGGNR